MWVLRKGAKHSLHPTFLDRPNWALRGLYWLSKDLFEPTFNEVSAPEAEGLAQLRNYLEHKSCHVVEYDIFVPGSTPPSGIRLSRSALEEKSLYVLKLARAALMYLSLAVHAEERTREGQLPEGMVAAMPLMPWKSRRRY